MAVVAVHKVAERHGLFSGNVDLEELGFVFSSHIAAGIELFAPVFFPVAEIKPGPVPEVGLGQRQGEIVAFHQERAAGNGSARNGGNGGLEGVMLLRRAEAVGSVPAFVILVEEIIGLVFRYDVLFLGIVRRYRIAESKAFVIETEDQPHFPLWKFGFQFHGVLVAEIAVLFLNAYRLLPRFVDPFFHDGHDLDLFRPGLVREINSELAGQGRFLAVYAQSVG